MKNFEIRYFEENGLTTVYQNGKNKLEAIGSVVQKNLIEGKRITIYIAIEVTNRKVRQTGQTILKV